MQALMASDYSLWPNLGLFAVSILFSGLYSGCEAALVSCSIDRAKLLIQMGGPKARALEFLVDNSNEILTTILVGNNLVNIFAASIATEAAQFYFKDDGLAISVGISTFFILLFGEVVPKTFARTNGEKYIVPAIRALQINFYLLYPVIKMFMLVIRVVLGKNAELSSNIVTKSDIEFMVNKAEKEKTMDSKQLDLLSSILEFPKIKVKDIMIPRQQVIYIDQEIEYEDLLDLILAHNHSRYPVCTSGDLDHIIGFMHVKDLVGIDPKGRKKFKMEQWIKKPFFIYEHMKIQSVFDHMNRKKVHIAMIKDENGIFVGIITLEDIMEQIFGEINDEHDFEQGLIIEVAKLGEQGILVEGTLSLRDLYNSYRIKIPLNDNYSTLAGFLLDKIGNNFPKTGMMIFLGGYSFNLELVEDQEIKKVRICDVEGENHLFPHESDSDAKKS